MLYTDLRELKRVLEIDPANTAEDVRLNLWIEQASNLIEEFLGRPGMEYKERTEYYAGTATQKLLLRSRPVFATPVIKVYEDNGGYYGTVSGSFAETTALTYGTDFALIIDQDNGTSRSGMLLMIDSLWEQPQVRETGFLSPYIGEAFGNYKIVYTAGYTIDTLPAAFRFACNLLVARFRYLMPLGMALGSESYEERSISVLHDRDYLMGLIRPFLYPYRNWKW